MELYEIINFNNININYIKCKFKIMIIKIFFSLIILNLICIIFYKKPIKDNYNIINSRNSNLIPLEQYLLFNYSNYNITRINYFNFSNLNYNYSLKFQSIEIEYKIGFYNNNKDIVEPSFLTLYNKLHIFCQFKLINKNISIYSLPHIYQNKYYSCIEIFNINEKIKLGIKILVANENKEIFSLYFFTEKNISLKNLKYINNYLFDPLIINEKFISLSKIINDKKINKTLKFKKSYMKYPSVTLKRFIALDENIWYFKNNYNNYYCFCKGEKCLIYNVTQKCKYYFYLNIIDNNRYIFKKTDYLFMDFIFAELSSDDVYPVFKQMVYQNLPVHYITEKIEIYNEFCYQNLECLTIIPVNKQNYTINGDFLENYLFLLLKLKAVISGRAQGFNYLTNIFYNLEYIIYIGVGHGVSFFKYFLYGEDETYGINQNDKLLIPPSDKLISVAKRYGWTDDNLIKMNLPRWDKYNNYNNLFIFENNSIIQNNSIFIMFTWRDLKKKKAISSFYFKNIIYIIESQILYKLLEEKNIILYFSFHHLVDKYINKYKKKYENNNYIRFIDANQISECLSKTNLVVTDFSSIIFDLIYRRKPFIIYIPDVNDSEIKTLYKKKYYELITSMKNGSIEFENKFFEVNETINKIIYYINNNFQLEPKLETFYDCFQLKNISYINIFINYLKNLQ